MYLPFLRTVAAQSLQRYGADFMAVQAKWYNKKFQCSKKKINLIESLTTKYEINEVTKTDKKGKSKTTKKGLKAQIVSFTIKPLYAAGVNPRSEFQSYKKLIGKTGKLSIGGKKFGPYLMLTSASLSDVELDNKGHMLSCSIALEFEQSTKKKYKKDAKKLAASKKKKTKNSKAKTVTKKTAKVGSKVKITGSKYKDKTKVTKSEMNKKYTIKSVSGDYATLSNNKTIALSSLSLC